MATPKITEKRAARFWSRVDKQGQYDCWNWKGKPHRGQGYGGFRLGVRNQTFRVNRVAWLLTKGPIPDGMLVCHHCDNRMCVNPSHLFLGTYANNNRDRAVKGRGCGRKNNSGPRLRPSDVRAIRREAASGVKRVAIARNYGVSYAAVWAILSGRSWKKVMPC